MTTKSKLRLVGGDTLPTPARPLGEHGLALWRSVQSEYLIADTGGTEMLLLACQALDRAEGLSADIARDGAVIQTRSGLRDHPALKHELAARAFVARSLQRLGLNFEAVRPVGRPPMQGYTG